jgi:hypothetical protein
MYTLARSMRGREFLIGQVPALGASLVVAELLYKFHSFTLECLAFLGTWFVFDALGSLVIGSSRDRATGKAQGVGPT